MTNWNPKLDLRFADHRLRPALDLIARIGLAAPEAIYDLGCGAGNVSLWLRRRWLPARIFGIDSSGEMLAQAAKTMPDLIRHQCDIADWPH